MPPLGLSLLTWHDSRMKGTTSSDTASLLTPWRNTHGPLRAFLKQVGDLISFLRNVSEGNCWLQNPCYHIFQENQYFWEPTVSQINKSPVFLEKKMSISWYYCHCLWINLNNTIKSTINQLVRHTIAAAHAELIAFISFSCYRVLQHMNVVMHHPCVCHPGWVQLIQFTCLVIYLNTTIICASLEPCLELDFVSASNIDALWHTSVGFVPNNLHSLREFSVAFRRPFVHPSFGQLPVSSASPSGLKLSSLCCPVFCTSQVTTTEVINKKHLSRTSILWLIQPSHTGVDSPEDLCILYSNRAACYLKDGNSTDCIQDCTK